MAEVEAGRDPILHAVMEFNEERRAKTRAAAARYRERNREKYNTYHAEYRRKNADKCKEADRKRYEEKIKQTPEKCMVCGKMLLKVNFRRHLASKGHQEREATVLAAAEE